MDKRENLYSLEVEAGQSCFYNFDPSDYTEVGLYDQNPAFSDPKLSTVLSMANEAIVYLTRKGSAYEEDPHKRVTFVSAKEERIRNKKGIETPAFSAEFFQAFKIDKLAIESAVSEALQIINDNLDEDQNEAVDYNQYHILIHALELSMPDYKDEASERSAYKHERLLAALALWKVDRLLASLFAGDPVTVMNLTSDIKSALEICKYRFEKDFQIRAASKLKSKEKASFGKSRHKALEPLKERALELYKKKKYRSFHHAATQIAEILKTEKKQSGVEFSDEEAVTTLSKWIKEFDRLGHYLK